MQSWHYLGNKIARDRRRRAHAVSLADTYLTLKSMEIFEFYGGGHNEAVPPLKRSDCSLWNRSLLWLPPID
ncbi:hypothetical protein CEXT_296431 [Caerostris extrusa]|uniref:Uncharacterized protein n=1 Tax=Caerostris extrusa TaxID=172846 RepID=A0AAV4Y8T4_CAEEX|nr:hypothetical protein CEXT_296431 [Caerostris extrusa]